MSRRSSSDGWNKKREADWILFSRSAAFRCILLNRPGIEAALGARPMKVLPVRYVVRLFVISERLLWKWRERKVLCTYHRPSKHLEHYKKGVVAIVKEQCALYRRWSLMARTSSLAAKASPRWTACGSERIVKNGRSACGHQQFRCRVCGVSRVLPPKSHETAPEHKAEVLRAVATERLSLRAAQRVFGVARGTITLWLQKTESLPPLSETLLPAQAGDVLELGRALELCGQQSQRPLCLERPLPPDPPGRGVFCRGSFRRCSPHFA